MNDVNMSTIKTTSNHKSTSKVPVLKITINKRYNKPYISKPNENELASDVNKTSNVFRPKKHDPNKNIGPSPLDYTQNVVTSAKPVIFNLIPVVFEKSGGYKDTFAETRHTHGSKVAYTRRGDLSRDTRNQSVPERIKYLHTKAQRDCDILRIRLKALRERHKQEKDEIKKLQMYLNNLNKNVTRKSINEMSDGHLKRKQSFVSLEDAGEEDECEKLLRKVKKIKQDILNLKHSYTTSKKRDLEHMNALNHNANIINQECKIFMKNSILENKDTINDLYMGGTPSDDNEIQNSEESYLESDT